MSENKDSMPKNITELYGTNVFNGKVMKEMLPQEIFASFKKTLLMGSPLSLDMANIIAEAMKNWAIENGAYHFTHWFQPMTGITAEKHTSFIVPDGDHGVLLSFSGKELVKGESDASSFPNGGLRTTFEARGYTAWDATSYAFIKDNVLCIPTMFCSYAGEALDKKTPLIRSLEAIDKQAQRILKLFGHKDVQKIIPTVGAEQEYFLVDKELFLLRPDLLHCGRTLFGAKALKGQDMEDHYYGAIKAKVLDFMQELEEELLKLGVLSKMQHNEVAPAQHELAPLFETANIATDHNQLTMELMQDIADKHGLACLLHEKPFAGINGSGKHNNWSLITDTGHNLLDPGDTPQDNAQFLLFLMAVIKAVDSYQDLLRASVATAANDHRLGGNEAPPAIISIFLGNELTAILEAIENDTPYCGDKKQKLEIGVSTLPHFPRDVTDRNRTSPFAFTNNKFEYRMVGSALSIAHPNWIINTIVAESLESFTEVLEKSTNFTEDLQKLIKDTIKTHKKIIFNGNNYSKEWEEEAQKRGLSINKNAPDALQALIKEDNIAVLEKHHVLSRLESESRYGLLLKTYCKTVRLEALTLLEMIKKNILPDTLRYQKSLAESISLKKSLSLDFSLEETLLLKFTHYSKDMYQLLLLLEEQLITVNTHKNKERAFYYRDSVLSTMEELRAILDPLETWIPRDQWSLPTYEDLLYSVV